MTASSPSAAEGPSPWPRPGRSPRTPIPVAADLAREALRLPAARSASAHANDARSRWRRSRDDERARRPARSAGPSAALSPREIVAELDRWVVGQRGERGPIALRSRIRRRRLPPAVAAEVTPKNIILIGPTGVGKTEIAAEWRGHRRPIIKVEATKFTEVGYVGRDVESIIRDLVAAAVDMVRREKQGAKEDPRGREAGVEPSTASPRTRASSQQ